MSAAVSRAQVPPGEVVRAEADEKGSGGHGSRVVSEGRHAHATDRGNRLVAGELERRWNQSPEQVADLESRVGALRTQSEPLSQREKARLLELGSELRMLWQHPAAPVALKKRILRTVLEEIVVNNTDEPPQHILRLHWKGGAHTERRVTRNGTGQHRRVADEKAVELITELSKICDDKTIAVVLNRLGYRNRPGADLAGASRP